MNRAEAYMNLLDAIQDYIQTVHTDEHYARNWVLVSGIQELNGTVNESQVRIDMSPNTSTWSIYGLLTLGIDNFHPETTDE
jgi:hypothetical protein